ncbi:gliding motility-related protein [Arcticibacter svalbardensis MN12-7]|uniref:Gliding motility-related protein n=1 Tax=Arcticibacter svalbardensis MN12-7 TaxID=1150600 RepID=R9H109_9SPHI|nr:outer membrane lipoprotein carrier protein LolA [Arcticibacter svalbardensis]EOR94924.1 gliding motility-related protein [Arcticibacter svalbardensis MN12-7]
MKKLLFTILILFSISAISSAQTDPKAKAILAAVSKKYSAYNIIKANFSYTIENPQSKIKQTESGTLYTKSKSNKFKIITSTQDMISDGKSQWTYLKQDKEVNLSNVDNSSNSINPAKIFTIYEKGYKYVSMPDIKENARVYNVIDLTPTASGNNFFKIRLTIDKLNKQIYKAMIFDKNGSRYSYLIKSLLPVKISESIFSFNPQSYPGVEVVDLR